MTPAIPLLRAACAVLLAGSVSGCLQSPTYGTGKRSDVQLLEDVANIMTVTPKRAEPIEYQPRPELVKPASTEVLPAPQESLARTSGNWPESPEERRARLRAEATANQGNNLYRSSIINTGLGQVNTDGALTPEQQREKFRAGLAVQTGAYQERRFLSDPPAEYKQPADTAAAGDLGEPELKKERRRKKLARKPGGFSLRDLWPF